MRVLLAIDGSASSDTARRNVLLHTPASVLVVRGPERVRAADRRTEESSIAALFAGRVGAQAG